MKYTNQKYSYFEEYEIKYFFKNKCKINEKLNFLDIFYFNTGTWQPYRKPNSQLIYINIKSDHPPKTYRGVHGVMVIVVGKRHTVRDQT